MQPEAEPLRFLQRYARCSRSIELCSRIVESALPLACDVLPLAVTCDAPVVPHAVPSTPRRLLSCVRVAVLAVKRGQCLVASERRLIDNQDAGHSFWPRERMRCHCTPVQCVELHSFCFFHCASVTNHGFLSLECHCIRVNTGSLSSVAKSLTNSQWGERA